MKMTIKRVERKKLAGRPTKMKESINKETTTGANFVRNQQIKTALSLIILNC